MNDRPRTTSVKRITYSLSQADLSKVPFVDDLELFAPGNHKLKNERKWQCKRELDLNLTHDIICSGPAAMKLIEGVEISLCNKSSHLQMLRIKIFTLKTESQAVFKWVD